MASSMCLILVMCGIFISTVSGVRVDTQRGYRLCPGKQLGRIVSIEADGPGCINRNGQAQWPCLAIPGKAGTFSISFMHDKRGGFNNIDTSIHANVKIRALFGIRRKEPIRGEVRKNACSLAYTQTARGPQYGCPINPGIVYTINKTVNVPRDISRAERNMNVELKLTDTKGNTIVCFTAPMLKA